MYIFQKCYIQEIVNLMFIHHLLRFLKMYFVQNWKTIYSRSCADIYFLQIKIYNKTYFR